MHLDRGRCEIRRYIVCKGGCSYYPTLPEGNSSAPRQHGVNLFPGSADLFHHLAVLLPSCVEKSTRPCRPCAV